MQIERRFTAAQTVTVQADQAQAWPVEMTDGFYTAVPTSISAIEENTVPSWLWRHQSGEGKLYSEISPQEIFRRTVGGATYRGWKKDLFTSETEARAFYDEALFMLEQRLIAIAPTSLRFCGLDWAYGVEPTVSPRETAPAQNEAPIANSVIDVALSNDKRPPQKWQQLLRRTTANEASAAQFSDTAHEWGTVASKQAPRLVLNMAAFLREDNTIDSEGLRHVAHIALVLLEMNFDQLGNTEDVSRGVAIGMCNLSSIFMSLGLAYDSAGARSIAAALTAILAAQLTQTSAQLALQFGPCPTFTANRELYLRSVRNRRRAAYGDSNDYERVSILPQPLELAACPDLALAATARRCWDEAAIDAQKYGLRHAQLTDFFTDRNLIAVMTSANFGAAPEPVFVIDVPNGAEKFSRAILPSAWQALKRLQYAPDDVKAIIDHAVGRNSLNGAPAINPDSLRKAGLSANAIDKIEAYLPQARHLRFAATPWIVGAGEMKALKVDVETYTDSSFDLLKHLGFSEAQIERANKFCCGAGDFSGASELAPAHRAVFRRAADISAEAQIRMAAAVQPFVTGTIALTLAPRDDAQQNETLFLMAWRLGLKSLALHQPSAPDVAAKPTLRARKPIVAPTPLMAAPRRVKAQASRTLVAKTSRKTPGSHKTKAN